MTIIAVVLFVVPSNTQGISGAFALGLLLAQYTIAGFDASAHVSEETRGARTEAPKAIVRSIYIPAIAGLILNLALIATRPKAGDDGDSLYAGIVFGDASDPFLVNPTPRLLSSVLGTTASKVLLFIIIGGQFFCGLASVTANSRMIYAFSRDGALPGSRYWHRLNPRTRTPTNSVWLAVALSALVGASSLYVRGTGAGRYPTAFFAMTGICVIGLYLSYAIPIYLRLTNTGFVVGPWHLKGHHRIIGWTALAWVAFITMLFFAPLFWPFWPFWPIWGSGNEIAEASSAGNTYFRQNNLNFTGPLVVLAVPA